MLRITKSKLWDKEQCADLYLHDSLWRIIGKDLDAGKDWRQEEKGVTEDEMVGWYHWLNGHELERALGDGDGQGSLECCSPWGRKELGTTEGLNNNLTIYMMYIDGMPQTLSVSFPTCSGKQKACPFAIFFCMQYFLVGWNKGRKGSGGGLSQRESSLKALPQNFLTLIPASPRGALAEARWQQPCPLIGARSRSVPSVLPW